MEITYKMIKPLIKKEELINGNQINLEFCANNQKVATQTVALIIAEQGEITKNATKQVVKGAVKSTLISQVLNLIGLGGIERSMVKSTANGISNKNQDSTGMLKTEITQEKKEKAIVDAFKNLMAMYKYNEEKFEWELVSS